MSVERDDDNSDQERDDRLAGWFVTTTPMTASVAFRDPAAPIPVDSVVVAPGERLPSAPPDWPDDEFQVVTTSAWDGRSLSAWWRLIDGRPEPVEVRIRATDPPSDRRADPLGIPITAELVRNLPLGTMMREASRHLRRHGDQMKVDANW